MMTHRAVMLECLGRYLIPYIGCPYGGSLPFIQASQSTQTVVFHFLEKRVLFALPLLSRHIIL